MSRHLFVTGFLVILISASAGCRNSRFCNPCNNGCFGFAQSATLPAPPTGSLQIPSISQGQPYYSPNAQVPTTAQQPSYLVNPNLNAPTPANNSPSLAPQQGWRPVGSNNYSINTSGSATAPGVVQPPYNQPTNQPSLAPQRGPTNFASNQYQNSTSIRTASTANSGLSFKDSVNYQSTRVDERLDETRLPATDATTVRAPSGINVVPSGTRLAQAYPIYGTVVPGQPVYSAQPRLAYQTVQPTFQGYSQTQFAQPQPTAISGTVQYGSNGGIVYNTYPATYSVPANTTLAQSTATYDPQSSSNSGWRDRELTTQR